MSTYELPLSWAWGAPGAALDLRPLELPTGGWFVHAPQVPPEIPLDELRQRLQSLAEKTPLVCQGLDAAQLQALGAGEGAILMGSSARIGLEGYRPPHKVRNLARRAREAAVEEVAPAGVGAIQDELELAAHGGAATMRYVFRARVEDAQRAFVVRVAGKPAGLVSLTFTGGGAWHVELLVRHPEAVDGAMEALLARVVEVLQQEGQTRLDLGQVAFHVEEGHRAGLGPLNLALLAGVPAAVAATGHRFNFEGLRRFKNKFEVEWVPRYFAGWPRLRKRDLRAAADASDLGQFVRLLP
jgi:lysylphosphatidylglycerol synthetase-like protein (DUF2156 family)